MKRAPFGMLCVLAAALWACAAGSSSTQPLPGAPSASAGPSSASTHTAVLLQEIEREIGDAACDTQAQCHTIGVGAKACGGPEVYLAWSGRVTNAARLTELVSRHRDARRLENERSGRLSDCRVTPDPGAVCRGRAQDGKRVCQLGQGGRSAVGGEQ